MKYSLYINKLVKICNKIELQYNLFDFNLPKNVVGRCDYKNNKIMINEPVAYNALMTIAHEMGHYLSFLNNKNKDFNKTEKETLAYIYGWKLLKSIKSPISKKEWKDFHE